MMLSLLLYVVALLRGCCLSAYYVLATAEVLGINSGQKATLDSCGDKSCCSACVIRAVVACRVVFLDECKLKASPSDSQLESLNNT